MCDSEKQILNRCIPYYYKRKFYKSHILSVMVKQGSQDVILNILTQSQDMLQN